MIDAFLSRLTVFPIAKSRVLQIEFSSKDPALAARGANTVAALYLEAQQQAKRNEAKAASAWLSTKIDELRGKVAEADSKVEAFRAGSGLLAGANGMTVPSQQLADMTTQLATARSNQASAAAKAQSLRTMLHDGRLDEIPQVTRDESLRRYVEQRVALKAQIAQESRTLLPEHPRMKELAGELAGLDAEIRIEANKTVAALESDAKLAAADVDSLSASLARQSKTVATGNADDVQSARAAARRQDGERPARILHAEISRGGRARSRKRRARRRAHHRQPPASRASRLSPRRFPRSCWERWLGSSCRFGAGVAHALLTDPDAIAPPASRRPRQDLPLDEPAELASIAPPPVTGDRRAGRRAARPVVAAAAPAAVESPPPDRAGRGAASSSRRRASRSTASFGRRARRSPGADRAEGGRCADGADRRRRQRTRGRPGAGARTTARQLRPRRVDRSRRSSAVG